MRSSSIVGSLVVWQIELKAPHAGDAVWQIAKQWLYAGIFTRYTVDSKINKN